MDPTAITPDGAVPEPGRIVDGVYYPEIETRAVPWEAPERTGFLRSLAATWTFVVAQPGYFFAALPVAGDWRRSFWFAFLGIAVGQACALGLGRVVMAPVVEALGGVLPAEVGNGIRGLLLGTVAVQLALLPINVVSGVGKMLLRAVTYALAAWVLGVPGTLDRMLRVEAYAHATDWMYLAILAIVLPVGAVWAPAGGALAAWGFALFLLLLIPPLDYLLIVFLGLRFLGGLTTGQALFTVFFPFMLLVFAVGGVLFEWILVETALHLLLPGS